MKKKVVMTFFLSIISTSLSLMAAGAPVFDATNLLEAIEQGTTTYEYYQKQYQKFIEETERAEKLIRAVSEGDLSALQTLLEQSVEYLARQGADISPSLRSAVSLTSAASVIIDAQGNGYTASEIRQLKNQVREARLALEADPEKSIENLNKTIDNHQSSVQTSNEILRQANSTSEVERSVANTHAILKANQDEQIRAAEEEIEKYKQTAISDLAQKEDQLAVLEVQKGIADASESLVESIRNDIPAADNPSVKTLNNLIEQYAGKNGGRAW